MIWASLKERFTGLTILEKTMLAVGIAVTVAWVRLLWFVARWALRSTGLIE